MAKILLVEDEAGIRFGMREFLRAHEFAVEEADSAAGAEAAFRDFRPDAAVIDYCCPTATRSISCPACGRSSRPSRW